jgi:sulfur dioxygenase
MRINCEQLNKGPCKTYMISNDETNEIAIIDPVIERVDDYRKMIEVKKLRLSLVVETHTHADHISGAASLKDIFQCDYAMHANSPVKCATLIFGDDFSWELFNEISVKVIHSPGHTRDSICLVFPEWIFTGDALFLDDGGAGRDDLPGGDAAAHWETLRRLRKLPDSLIVYPAHDYRNRVPSSLGTQKKTNPHLLKSMESKEAFVRYLDDLKLGPADWMNDVLKANYACTRDPRAAWIPADAPACEVKGTLGIGANEVDVKSIPASVLRQKLGNQPAPVLLDVREKDELDGPLGHIDGIVHIPVGQLTKRLDDLQQYAGREIVVICRSGGRAHTAAQIMGAAGMKGVMVLEGGMTAWRSR